jgi:hypothetical protein
LRVLVEQKALELDEDRRHRVAVAPAFLAGAFGGAVLVVARDVVVEDGEANPVRVDVGVPEALLQGLFSV